MGINKKRIAERQKAAELAKKQEKNKKVMKKVLVIAIAVAIVAAMVGVIAMVLGKDKAEAGPSNVYYADITIKGYGKIVVELDREAAPITVDNFVNLAKSGFYDGLTFHRIIKGFMMQGGDPEGTGSGGSGTDIKGEFAANGWKNPISHLRGTISMARANEPDSGSSQFFIVQKDSTYLDGSYAGFGRVIEGIEIVDMVCNDTVPTDNNGSIAKDEQPIIESIKIREK